MRSSIILLIFLYSVSIQSQNISIDIGTKWIYQQGDFVIFNPDDFVLIVVERDTFINDERFLAAREYYLDRSNGVIDSFLNFTHYIRQDSTYLFYYDPSVDSTLTLYDFDVEVGDQYDMALGAFNYSIGQSNTSLMEVVRISEEVIENRTWELQELWPVESGLFAHNKPIVKGIGGLFHLFPSYAAVDPPPGGKLLCFDNGTDYYPSQLECDLVLPTKNISVDRSLIFPNPNHGVLELEKNIEEVLLYDITGRLIVRNKGQSIDFSLSPNGYYVLVQIHNSGDIYVDRIYKGF